WFTLLDDLQFNDQGIPKLDAGAVLQRNTRYSWAYLCKQVKTTPPPATTAPDGIELTVVVYDRRPELPGSTGSLPNEIVLTGNFIAGQSYVDVTYTAGNKPAVNKGTWILDATANGTVKNGYFYRVASAEDGPTANSLRLALTQPVRDSSGVNGVCVVMQNVAEVFEKGIRK
ncbi:MAG: hypothetical protein AB7K24_27845, partial [Gemmataceae bacterium]